jgi:hypothetical protein
VSAIEVMIGWKSVSPGAMPILPAHCGLARSITDEGSCDGGSADVLYTSAETRAVTPAQFPAGELYPGGTAASVLASAGARRRCPASFISAGEFSVKMTSAGDREPSCMICSASWSSSPLLTVTVIPVCFSNAFTSACVVCSCCPL